MHKMVYGVFKALAVSMILVFAFDMGMYLYKAISLDQKMKRLMRNMQTTVSENNGLSPEAYNTYVALIQQIASDLNGAEPNSFVGTPTQGKKAIFLNYNADAWGVDTTIKSALTGSSSNVDLKLRMNDFGDYGDIMVVQSAIMVRQPAWQFIGTNRGSQDFQNDRTNGSIAVPVTVFTYTYYVPCMNYSNKTK